MEDNKIKVYIKIDSNNCITHIDSSIFLQDITNWICIDEGYGDKYSHAQGMYFPNEKPLRDMQGRCNYKYLDNNVVELTDEEKEVLYPPIPPQPTPLEKTESDLKKSDSYLLKLSTLGIDEVQKLKEIVMELQNKITILEGGK